MSLVWFSFPKAALSNSWCFTAKGRCVAWSWSACLHSLMDTQLSASESVQALVMNITITASSSPALLRIWLQLLKFCHEIPDGSEAHGSSCWEQYPLQNMTTHAAAQNPLLFLSASLSLVMNLLFKQHQCCLGNLSLDCVCALVSTHLYHGQSAQWWWQNKLACY